MKQRTRKLGVVALRVVLMMALAPSTRAQPEDGRSPILEAREVSGGCCQPSRDTTYLRVFSDGRAEWDVYDEKQKSYVTHQTLVSKKQMRAVKWAIRNMKGLGKSYTGKYAAGNIDSYYSFQITTYDRGKTYETDVFFGLEVDSENYSELPVSLRTVACNVAITRSRLAHEEADLNFCRKYYVGW